MKTNLGFAITGSFCTHQTILKILEKLKQNFNILPIFSQSVLSINSRFGKAKDFVEKVEKICEQKGVSSIVDAEPIGPNNKIDVLVIAPCTGNTLAKLANAITDNAVTMVAKSHTRNNKPVVVGISSNDALGLNAFNLAKLLNAKNYFFVPFFQDDFEKKPKSLVANWENLEKTINYAILGKQVQPILSFKEVIWFSQETAQLL